MIVAGYGRDCCFETSPCDGHSDRGRTRIAARCGFVFLNLAVVNITLMRPFIDEETSHVRLKEIWAGAPMM